MTPSSRAHAGALAILTAYRDCRTVDEREDVARIVAHLLSPNGYRSLAELADAALLAAKAEGA